MADHVLVVFGIVFAVWAVYEVLFRLALRNVYETWSRRTACRKVRAELEEVRND